MTVWGKFLESKSKLSMLYSGLEAESILYRLYEKLLGYDKVTIALNKELILSHDEEEKLDECILDLLAEKPVQYILGEVDFYDCKIEVNENVLIPRPETEELVDFIFTENPGFRGKIMDIGTGSGCIAIALKKAIPAATVIGVDSSGAAIEVAFRNAQANEVPLSLIKADILDKDYLNTFAYYDIMVSNPPYVLVSEKKHMKKNVLNYEPEKALFVKDDDPFIFYKAILDFAKIHLKNKGKLYLEINERFGEDLKGITEAKGFRSVRVRRDLSNKSRFLIANK